MEAKNLEVYASDVPGKWFITNPWGGDIVGKWVKIPLEEMEKIVVCKETRVKFMTKMKKEFRTPAKGGVN